MAQGRAHRWLWFAALWTAGVLATGALAYALRWMLRAG